MYIAISIKTSYLFIFTRYVSVCSGVQQVGLELMSIVNSVWTASVDNNAVILSNWVYSYAATLPVFSVIWNNIQAGCYLQYITRNVYLICFQMDNIAFK